MVPTPVGTGWRTPPTPPMIQLGLCCPLMEIECINSHLNISDLSHLIAKTCYNRIKLHFYFFLHLDRSSCCQYLDYFRNIKEDKV